MADIPSLRIGDTLKVPYTIEALIQDQPSNRPVRVDEGLWLRRELVEAAQHIPAPRVFKRGDWVSWRAHGAVQMVVADADDELVWVTSDDPANNILWRKQDCELTEAPE